MCLGKSHNYQMLIVTVKLKSLIKRVMMLKHLRMMLMRKLKRQAMTQMSPRLRMKLRNQMKK